MRNPIRHSWSPYCFRVGVLISAFCCVTAFGKDDGEFSLTGIGGGIISQSFEFSRRFVRPEEDEDGTHFLNTREKNLAKPKKKKILYLPLSWTLGAGFTFLDSAALATSVKSVEIIDAVISLKGGLDWTPIPSLNLTMDLNVDNNTFENYNHGAFLFRFTNTFLLHPKPIDKSQLPSEITEADEYYKKELKEKEKAFAIKKKIILASEDEEEEDDENLPEPFPAIKVGLVLGFGEHLVSGKLYRNTLLGSLNSDQRLFQNEIGFEAAFLQRAGLTWRLAWNMFYYNIPVDTYLPYLEIGTMQRFPLIAYTGWNSATNQLLTFPSLSVDQSVEIELNENEKFQIFLNESAYASVQQSTMISLTPEYTRRLGKNWIMSLDPFLGITVAGTFVISGMIRFSYDTLANKK